MRLITSSLLCVLLSISAISMQSAQAKSDHKKGEDNDLVEVMQSLKLTKAQVQIVEDNHKTLQSNQALIEKVLNHLGVDYYVPLLPTYRSLGANSILSLTDQFYYAAAAKKLGAKLPENYNGKSGSSLANNLFLHDYNNEILRSIAKKLDLPAPEKPSVSQASEQTSAKVIKQNHEILTSIANKLGVKP